MNEENWNPLKLTREQAKKIVYYGSERFEQSDFIDHGKVGRWSIREEIIFKDATTSRYYSLPYTRGATENQDEQPFDHEDPKTEEVFQKEVKVLKWVSVKEGEK